MDVYQPLCRGRIIKVEGGEKIWVNFRYERLPNICYWCGCFDHSDKDCDAWIESRGTLQTTTQLFGSWLRANQSGPSKKGVVRVSGFYEGRAENTSTRRRRERGQFHMQAKSSETPNQPEKENSEMETDLADITNSGVGNVTAKHGKEDSPNMAHNIVGDYFSQKIREIDKDLGINDEPTILAQTENTIPNKDTSPLFDLENLKKDLEENQSPLQPLHHLSPLQGSRGPPLQDISNIPQKLAPNFSTLQAKWKRYPRVAEKNPVSNNNNPATNMETISSKCPITMLADQSELPSKKLLVSYADKDILPEMAEAGSQPRQAQ